MDTSKIVIRGARVLVKEDKFDVETKSGIIMPGKDKEATHQGVVLAVGDGAMLENGTLVPVKVNVGDKVLYTAFSGSPIVKADDPDAEDVKYLILNERDILCQILD